MRIASVSRELNERGTFAYEIATVSGARIVITKHQATGKVLASSISGVRHPDAEALWQQAEDFFNAHYTVS